MINDALKEGQKHASYDIFVAFTHKNIVFTHYFPRKNVYLHIISLEKM